MCVRRHVALCNEVAEFFCDVETDLLHIIYINFELQKVKVKITDKLTCEETHLDLL